MEAIQAVLFEPVGCLAEFQTEDFNRAATVLFGAPQDGPSTGSQAYWRLISLLDRSYDAIAGSSRTRLEQFELAAVERAELYEDVGPSLEQIRRLGVATFLVSSLSRQAVQRFVERFSLGDLFVDIVSRDEAGGVMAQPLRHLAGRGSLEPRRIMYLVDTAEALEMTKQQGLNAVLMINDYDEGRALAEQSPAGGIVSLAELVQALQVIEQRSGIRNPPRAPRKPFDVLMP